jgi:aminoglycoside phosphotransferase (APT) family kinase protein
MDVAVLTLDAVHGLVAAQFPQWADRPLVRIPSAGTDNTMYRLGEDLVVRLPRHASAAEQVGREQRWLPHLARHLPLPVPAPVGRGAPGNGYPLPWSVYRWLDGEDAVNAPIADLRDAAAALGNFIAALRRVDARDGPPSSRGVPLHARDAEMRAAVGRLAFDGEIDGEAAIHAWEQAIALPQWSGLAVWLHGDLMPGNLLTRSGRLSAVIDWGLLGVGDPACDLIPAWFVFDAGSRQAFRAAADLDDATWARGRGRALRMGVGAADYYRLTNPVLAAVGRRAMSEALADS